MDNKTLFHYCSTTTLLSVINNKQLWMSDISKSNDFSEMTMFFPDIYYAVEKEYEEEPFDYSYDGKTGVQAIKRLLELVEKQIRLAFDRGRLTSYVVCFCEDGDTLGQWRGYGDDGKGFSIGFSLEELEKYCDEHNKQLAIEPIEYLNKHKRSQILQNEAKGVLAQIKILKRKIKREFGRLNLDEKKYEELEMIVAYDLFEGVAYDSLKYKWDSFAEEKEWRLFFREITKDDKTLFANVDSLEEWRLKYDKNLAVLHGKIDFYAKSDSIVPYYPVSLLELSGIPIKHLVIGPKNLSFDQDIRLLFSRSGLGLPEVSYSRITYR